MAQEEQQNNGMAPFGAPPEERAVKMANIPQSQGKMPDVPAKETDAWQMQAAKTEAVERSADKRELRRQMAAERKAAKVARKKQKDTDDKGGKGTAPDRPARARQRAGQERWHRLDNTANLFPVITNKKGSNVYRLSVNLRQPVDADLLQQALEKVLPRFAAFRVRLRRGVFWHYLEANPAMAAVYEEDDYPCRTIDPRQNDHFLFRVTYFGSRINLEIYHVLTDGTGGMRFLQALCCQYLLLAYPHSFSADEKARPWFVEHAADTEDSYVRNYTPTKKANFRIGRGYRLRGERDRLGQLGVVHAHVPVQQLLTLCRSKGVSITQYITACIGWAIFTKQMGSRPPKHPANIFVPVNLRKLFESTTALNFFSNIYISLDFQKPGISFDDVLTVVKAQFDEKLSREAMLEKISYTVGSGYSLLVRLAPLPLKHLVLRIIYEASANSSTLGYSNLGAVHFPAVFQPYVCGASFMLSTVPREPFKCASCSYDEVFTLSFTSILRNMELQRAIVRQLATDGLDVTVETNGVDYETL